MQRSQKFGLKYGNHNNKITWLKHSNKIYLLSCFIFNKSSYKKNVSNMMSHNLLRSIWVLSNEYLAFCHLLTLDKWFALCLWVYLNILIVRLFSAHCKCCVRIERTLITLLSPAPAFPWASNNGRTRSEVLSFQWAAIWQWQEPKNK